MRRVFKFGCFLLAVAGVAIVAAGLLDPDPGAFEFMPPRGWTVLKDAKGQLLQVEGLSPEMRNAIQRTNYSMYAVDSGGNDGPISATFNAIVSNEPVWNLTPLSWSGFLNQLTRATSEQTGVAIRVVKYTVEDLHGVPVGRAVTDLRTADSNQRQVCYYIPGRSKAAFLTYGSEAATFDSYMKAFDESARATKGASNPRVSDYVLRLFHRMNSEQIGGAVGFVAGVPDRVGVPRQPPKSMKAMMSLRHAREISERTLVLTVLACSMVLAPGRVRSTEQAARAPFTVRATTADAGGELKPGVPAFRVEITGEIPILIRIERVVRGRSPWVQGQEITLLIHSPSLMFGRDGWGKSYWFTFEPVSGEAWRLTSCTKAHDEDQEPVRENPPEWSTGCSP